MTAILGFLAAIFIVAAIAGLIAFAIWAKKKGWKFNWKWGCAVATAIAAVFVVWALVSSISTPSVVVEAKQIYPNWEFPDGVNQMKIPLLPANQVLSREAGGWVITPAGSGYRISYDTDVVIEYNDGRKFVRHPGKPAHDGVRPANGIFRLYGTGEATVTIHRGVYVNRWE